MVSTIGMLEPDHGYDAVCKCSHSLIAVHQRPNILSPRERDILDLIAQGATYLDIAGELMITEETVRTHVKRVLKKLRAKNSSHAVGIGMSMGMIRPLAGA